MRNSAAVTVTPARANASVRDGASSQVPPSIDNAPACAPLQSASDVPAAPQLSELDDTGAGAAGRSSIVGGLSSAVVHLGAFICLGLLYITIEDDRRDDLQLAIASERVQPLEFVAWSSPGAPVASVAAAAIETPTISPVALTIEEPSLTLLDTGTPPTGESFDLTFPVSSGSTGAGPSHATGTSGLTSEFFGVTAAGDTFVYVLDVSTSMRKKSHYGRTRFQVAAAELVRSVDNLSQQQQFYVILFSYRTRLLFDGTAPKMRAATPDNKRRLRRWLSQVALAPGTDPRLGVMTGLRMRPSAIFLLSDGEFNGRDENRDLLPGNPTVEQVVAASGRQHTPIHTIALESRRNRKRLRRLSQATGGSHRFVSVHGEQRVLLEDLTSNAPDDVCYAMQAIARRGNLLGQQQRQRAAAVLVRMLATDDVDVRSLAHRALLAISDGQDFGPHHVDNSRQEILGAQQRWTDYWNQIDTPIPTNDMRSDKADARASSRALSRSSGGRTRFATN